MKYVLMDETHIKEIAQLEKICFSDPWSEKSIASEVGNPLSLWIVALEGGRVVGYVGSQSVLGWADMMNLAVMPEFRKQGIGRRLICELIEQLKQKQVTCLTLEVRCSNNDAISLYEI